MKKSYKFLITSVLVIGAAGIIAAAYMFNLRHKDLSKVRPDYVISAEELQKAFETDESGATGKYVNQVLEVTGIIFSVKEGENNALSISLKTLSDLSAIICTLQETSGESDFKSGDQVTIRGECSGFLMDVLLNNCTVINK